MALDSTSGDPFDLAEHVVATSEPTTPQETLARLFGESQAGSTPVADQFAEHDITLDVEDFFLEEATRHELRFDDRVKFVPCVADALQAAILVDQEPATVRSVDPVSDTPVTFEVASDAIEVTPRDHVISIGAAETVVDDRDLVAFTVSALEGGEDTAPVPGSLRELGCQYINAFESVVTYREWAADVDAVTVAVPAEPLMPPIRRFLAAVATD